MRLWFKCLSVSFSVLPFRYTYSISYPHTRRFDVYVAVLKKELDPHLFYYQRHILYNVPRVSVSDVGELLTQYNHTTTVLEVEYSVAFRACLAVQTYRDRRMTESRFFHRDILNKAALLFSRFSLLRDAFLRLKQFEPLVVFYDLRALQRTFSDSPLSDEYTTPKEWAYSSGEFVPGGYLRGASRSPVCQLQRQQLRKLPRLPGS